MIDHSQSEPVIQIENFSCGYGAHRVLENVSLEVKQHEIFVIMGGSGTGKSTLLRHLLGLQQPESGHLRVLGRDVAALNKHELYELRRNIGVAFQGGALFSSMSVAENVQITPARAHQTRRHDHRHHDAYEAGNDESRG